MASITLMPEARPIFTPSRKIPIAWESQVKENLEDLLRKGIIEKTHLASGWSSPLVIVEKKSGELRICIDLRRINKLILRQPHRLPSIDSLAHKLHGATIFSKIDLRDAYNQILLKKDVRDLTTFDSPIGPCRYTRLSAGLCNAPELFQRVLEDILADIEGAQCYIDDIIVFAKDKTEHDARLFQVLTRFDELNISLSQQKCEFGKDEVEFLGYEFSKGGIKPSKSKLQALQDALPPKNKEEALSLLGLLSYIGSRALPGLADLTEPIKAITRKGAKFLWEAPQQAAFEEIKRKLDNMITLGYYSLTDKTELYADASPYAVGAVLVQIGLDKQPRVIAFANKSLSKEDRLLSQTQKEALACLWASEHYDYYLRGRKYDLFTDHKALETLLGIKKPTSSMTSARIERWLMRLQEYDFTIKYVPGRKMIADFFSRCVKESEESKSFDEEDEYIHAIMSEAAGAVTIKSIREHSAKDELIQQIIESLRQGVWTPQTKLYERLQDELTVANGMLLRGRRIFIPQTLIAGVLNIAHQGHPGICSMKRRIRARYYWRGLDKDIEEFVDRCDGCKLIASSFPAEPLRRTELPERAWQKLALDFMGPAPSGEKIFVVVDYFSRYFEIKYMNKTDAQHVINVLEEIFSRLDWPEELTTDNGPPFKSEEFLRWCSEYGIQAHQSLPYQPRMNGEVEIQNKILARVITISINTGQNWKKGVRDSLEAHRVTPHTVTGVPPLQLLWQRNNIIRGKLHSLPTVHESVLDEAVRDRDAQHKAIGKEYADKKYNNKTSELNPGDYVIVQRPRKTSKWQSRNFPYKFKVMKKNGSAVVIADEKGSWQVRDISQLVRVAPPEPRNVAIPIDDENEPVTDMPIQEKEHPGTPERSHEPQQKSQSEPTVAEERDQEPAFPPENECNDEFQPTQHSTPVVVTKVGRVSKKPAWRKDFV